MSRGIPGSSSSYADEGTAAHELGEKALRSGGMPHAFMGQTFNGFPVTQDMANNVNVYVEHVRSLQAEAGVGGLLEHRFSLKNLNPPAPMSGTADFVLHDKKKKRLHVVDLKYGAGVPVDVNDNPQLMYYALGAVVSLGLTQQVNDVYMTIVQPRIDHPDGPVRTQVLTPTDLLDFSIDLLAGADRALVENAPLQSGSHCRFCKAHAICPKVREEAMEVLGTEFDLVPIEDGEVSQTPPDPRLMTLEQIATLLPKFDAVEDWMRSVRAFAFSEAEGGKQIPGYKLVAKQAHRKWAVPEADVVSFAKAEMEAKVKDFNLDYLYERSLVSPAQMEKLLGYKSKQKLPGELVSKKSSGNTLVGIDDPRPAVNLLSAVDEFSSTEEDLL